MRNPGIQRSGSGIGYRRAGTGPPIVFLHGIPGGAASWREVAASLDASGYGFDIIIPDLLGFGGSERPRTLADLHAAAQAEAIDGLLAELGVGPAVVVGHDFGGPVALLLAARRPAAVAALGLLATNTFTDTPIPFPLSSVNWPFLGPAARRVLFGRASLRMMLRRGTGAGSPPDPKTYLGDRLQQRAIATIFAGSLVDLEALYRPVEAQLGALTVPVFVGWGDRDPFFPVSQGERTANAAKADLRVYHGAGHFLPHERPRDVAADVATLASAIVR